jgi:hypothetical protein
MESPSDQIMKRSSPTLLLSQLANSAYQKSMSIFGSNPVADVSSYLAFDFLSSDSRQE